MEKAIIDFDSKKVYLPRNLKVAGASGESNVKRIFFEVDCKTGNLDLSGFSFFIDYANESKDGRHHPADVVIDTEKEKICFSWLLSNRALSETGHLWFSVTAEGIEEEKRLCLKTRPESLLVLSSVEYRSDEDVDEDSPVEELTILVQNLKNTIDNWEYPKASKNEIGGIRLGGSLTMDEEGVVNVIPERELTINEIDAICV